MINLVDLTDKKIIVTGASSGIGKETAILLSRLGARVVLVARNEDRLLKTMSMLENGEHSYFVYDLSQLEGISNLIERIVNKDNRKIDGLVHSAGVSAIIPLQNINYEKMDQVMKINFYSFIELVKVVTLKKYSSGGSIVAISSIASTQGEKCQTIYSASKAAMDASIRTLAIELVKKKIRINSVMPGLINSEMTNQVPISSLQTSELTRAQLLGIGKPIDVANMIAFLISEASGFITGRSVYVDGGRFL